MAQAAYNSEIRKASGTAVSFTNEATTPNAARTQYTISNSAKRYLDIDTAVVVQAQHNEVQTVSLTGGPTGGTFTLTFSGQTTAGINHNANAAAVQSALEALSNIGVGDISVTGGPGPSTAWVVEFTGALGAANQPAMTGSGASLTGGSSPSVSIVETQNGSAYATISATTYTLIYPGGVVVFPSAQAIGTSIRLSSGKYYVHAAIGGGHAYEFSGKMNLEDVTEFNTTGTSSWKPTVMEGDMKWSVWFTNSAHRNSLKARDRLITSAILPDGSRFEGYCFTSDTSLKGETKGVLDQELSFHFTDQFYMH